MTPLTQCLQAIVLICIILLLLEVCYLVKIDPLSLIASHVNAKMNVFISRILLKHITIHLCCEDILLYIAT